MASQRETPASAVDSPATPSTQHQTPPTQTSGFFNLSAEIRNIIYSEVVEHDEPLWVTASRKTTLTDGTPPPLAAVPAVAQVCRLMRTESLPMFLGNNTFSITLHREDNVVRAKQWAAISGDAAIAHIRWFRLHGKLAQRHNYTYYAPATRVLLNRHPDGGVEIVDGNAQLANLPVRTQVGLIEELKKCLGNTSAYRKPLSSVGEVQALVKTFASRLYLLEDEFDSYTTDEE